MVDLNRRRFLRGDFSPKASSVRPPWALGEQSFLAACTRCRACIDACPESIVAPDPAGFPVVDFARGECSFCARCVEVCTPQALHRQEGRAPWRIKAAIGGNCIARRNVVCRACGDACAAQAIRFRPVVMAAAQPEVDAEKCTGCGACVAPCPVGAVRVA